MSELFEMAVVIEEIELEEKNPQKFKQIFKFCSSLIIIGSSACSICVVMCNLMNGNGE